MMLAKRRGRPPLNLANNQTGNVNQDKGSSAFYAARALEHDALVLYEEQDQALAIYTIDHILTIPGGQEKRDVQQQEAVLSCKRKFKDIKNQITQEMQGSQPHLNFLQKLNVTLDKLKLRISYPFKFAFSKSESSKVQLIQEPSKLESNKVIKKRIEKALAKKELERKDQVHAEAMDALNTKLELQQSQILQMREQMDKLVGHLLKHYKSNNQHEVGDK